MLDRDSRCQDRLPHECASWAHCLPVAAAQTSSYAQPCSCSTAWAARFRLRSILRQARQPLGRPPREAFGGLWDQDALMIGKTSRAVAMKCARPTTPSTANAAKDTVSTVMPSFGLMGIYFSFFRSAISPPAIVIFRLHSSTSTAAHKLVKTGESLWWNSQNQTLCRRFGRCRARC